MSKSTVITQSGTVQFTGTYSECADWILFLPKIRQEKFNITPLHKMKLIDSIRKYLSAKRLINTLRKNYGQNI